jgi:hypothetical protein
MISASGLDPFPSAGWLENFYGLQWFRVLAISAIAMQASLWMRLVKNVETSGKDGK